MKFFGVDVSETRGTVFRLDPYGGEPMPDEGIIFSATPDSGKNEPISIAVGAGSGELVRGLAAGAVAARVILHEWKEVISRSS